MEDKKTKRSDKRWKTVPRNGKRFTKMGKEGVENILMTSGRFHSLFEKKLF